jgi:hypothetical protein
MAAMVPLFKTIAALGGFEAACFWLAAFVIFMLTGFVLDYLLGRQGFGPYVNSVLALAGVFLALYARYNYLLPYLRYDPYLTCGLVVAVPALLILLLSFLRTRVF